MVPSRRAVLDRFLRFPLSPFSGAEETLNEREDAQLQRPAHGSLKSPMCPCVSITLPASRKHESRHRVNGWNALRSRLRC